MMELADVTDSKSVGSDTVRVQVPLPAPKQEKSLSWFLLFFVISNYKGLEPPRRRRTQSLPFDGKA